MRRSTCSWFRVCPATTIEDICERADVANRTFFNHFPTRHDMMRALAERRLLNLHDVVVRSRRRADPGPADRCSSTTSRRPWASSSDTYREVIAEMLASTRGTAFNVVSPCTTRSSNSSRKAWRAARSTSRHDAQTLADIIVGALTGGIVNWTVDKTYSLETGLHELAVALADLLGGDSNG